MDLIPWPPFPLWKIASITYNFSYFHFYGSKHTLALGNALVWVAPSVLERQAALKWWQYITDCARQSGNSTPLEWSTKVWFSPCQSIPASTQNVNKPNGPFKYLKVPPDSWQELMCFNTLYCLLWHYPGLLLLINGSIAVFSNQWCCIKKNIMTNCISYKAEVC